jgi:hypothetical protein
MSNNGLATWGAALAPLDQRSVAAASIGSSYTLIGAKFGRGVVQLIISGNLDQAVQISFDGVTDHIPFFNGQSPLVLDFRSCNGALQGYQGVYVKEIGNPTTGSLYVSAFGLK